MFVNPVGRQLWTGLATATELEPIAGVISDRAAHLGGIVVTGPLVGVALTHIMTAIAWNATRKIWPCWSRRP